MAVISDIYVVLIEERHAETDALAFGNEEAALEAARKLAARYSGPDEIEEMRITEEMQEDGRRLQLSWGSEGENVRVLRCRMRNTAELDY